MGMDAEALEYANRAAELGLRNNIVIAIVHSEAERRAGHYDVAADYALQSLPLDLRSAANSAAVVKQVFAAIAEPAKRAAASRSLTAMLRGLRPPGVPVPLTEWYVLLGDLDAAYKYASLSFDESTRLGTIGATPLWQFLWEPEMRPFRRDPRFQAFVTHLKLFDYWKEYGPPDECELRDEMLACS